MDEDTNKRYEGWGELTDEQRAEVEVRHNAIKKKIQNGEFKLPENNLPQLTLERLTETMNNLKDVDTKDATIKAWIRLSEEIAKITDVIPQYIDDATDPELKPYIDAELKDPMYNGKDLETLMMEAATDDHGEALEGELISILLSAAKEAREKVLAETPKIQKGIVQTIVLPVDKINDAIWHQSSKFSNGACNIDVASAKDKRKGKLEALYIPVKITFGIPNDLKGVLSEELTPYDGRLYTCLSTARHEWEINPESNEPCTITFSQLFKAIGGKGRPNKAQIERMLNSIRKMNFTFLTMDNLEESVKYKYERYLFKAEQLLRASIAPVLDDSGDMVDGIYIDEKPPLSMYAIGREQYTSFDKELYAFNLSLTDKNITIEDYIIKEISWMKNQNPRSAKRRNVILMDSIAKYAMIDKQTASGKKAFQRLKTPVNEILCHLKSIEFIKGFSIKKGKITIFY